MPLIELDMEIVKMLVVGLGIILILGIVRDLLARRREAKLYPNALLSKKTPLKGDADNPA